MENSFEYYDLFATSKLDGMLLSAADNNKSHFGPALTQNPITETLINFTQDVPVDFKMTDQIDYKNLKNAKDVMQNDANMDYSNKVSNPHGYGYIPSLNEVRNNDAIEIRNQESVIFSLGAIAGVSLIVLGVLVTSSSSATNT
jgi:hypothetical protein